MAQALPLSDIVRLRDRTSLGLVGALGGVTLLVLAMSALRQVRFYRETARQGAAAKTIRQQLLHNARGPFGVVGVQEGGEHEQ